MNELSVWIAIVLILGLFILGLVWVSQCLIKRKHHHMLSANPLLALETLGAAGAPPTRVKILAFSSEHCRQCHTLQAPVLRRVKEAHGDMLTIIEIDASNSPKLMSYYHVLTVPTTVLLDVNGKTHAINYGFTNAQSLLKQVEAILVLDEVTM